MLIIFDLDDTLVDTSGCITYYKLEQALRAMVAAGLKLSDFDKGLSLLRELNEKALSSKVALAEFVSVYRAGPLALEEGIREIYETDAGDLPVSALEGAVSVLTSLKRRHRLALVSIGIPFIQRQKLQKAGLDTSLFSKILITKEEDKKPLYEQVCSELGFSAGEVLVCGDRIARDLRPARELGFTTILMKWGRGLVATLPSPDVDYVISSLVELKKIVK